MRAKVKPKTGRAKVRGQRAGGFVAAGSHAFFTSIHHLTLADVDDDGLSDVVFGSPPRIEVWLARSAF